MTAMTRPESIWKRTDGIATDGEAIVYHNRLPVWLRLGVAVFGLLPALPFLAYFMRGWQQVDWANPPPVASMLASVIGFFVIPLLFATVALAFALLGRALQLRLDPRTGEAVLRRKGLFGMRVTRYPLRAVEIADIRLQAEYPAYEAPHVVLRMPDGRQVDMGCFVWDERAKDWCDRIRRLLSPPAGNEREWPPDK